MTDNDQTQALQTLSVISTVFHGVLTHHGQGFFTYQPNTNYIGNDTFTYQVCDTNNLCASSLVTLTVSNDIDGDGYLNLYDAFPENPDEWLDTDSDGLGNNADPDDDNDGMTDSDEIAVSRNPLFDEAVLIIINHLLLN